MPRPTWKGSVGFGLVNVPVEMIAATRDLGLHFRELHAEDDAPVRHERFCPKEGKPVSRDQTGHGYRFDDGEMVVLTDDELARAATEKNRTIEIESFVDLGQVDPIFFDRPYFLRPQGTDGGTLRAYRLLVEAMARANRVALGRFVLSTKEYLAALREYRGVLALSTMRFADEVRPIDLVPVGEADAPSRTAVNNAVAVVNELSTDWEPERYHDHYRERLEAVIESKRKGHTVTVPTPAEEKATPAPDLMAALKRSLEDARGGKQKNRSGSRRKSSGKKRTGKKAKSTETGRS